MEEEQEEVRKKIVQELGRKIGETRIITTY